MALHILNTIVRNTYKANPARLAEWASASHIQKHTPVAMPAAVPVIPPVTPTPPVPPATPSAPSNTDA